MTVAGRSAPRQDLRAKLSGEALFGADVRVDGMLHVRLLRSMVPHARITSLDITAAEDHPGVVCVVTAEDVADIDAMWGHYARDRPVFADQVIRFAGEIIAAVAAETPAAAEAAVAAIDVDYDELPPVLDVAAAVAADAPRVHPGPPRPGFACPPDTTFGPANDFYHWRVDHRRRQPPPGEGATIVVEHEYTFPAVYQYAMEPHAVVASYGADGIRVWSTCQHPFLVREELALIFGEPTDRVRVSVPFIGGGFGSKSYTKMEPVAVAVARKAGRPVSLVNRVEDAMVTTRRHGMRAWMRTVASPQGRLLQREARIWMDTGAYADNGPTVTMVAGMAAVGPYRWDRVSVDSACVYTNLPPAGSYRGFGAAHLQWVSESQVDEVAGAIGMDRLQIRTQNLLSRGERIVPGTRPLDADLAGDLTAVAATLGWGAALGEWEGRGISVGVSPAGASHRSQARVQLTPDGTVAVLVGSQEIGQGARTVHAQIAAEVLSMPLDQVAVVPTDTSRTPYDRSTGASRSTTVAGLAVQRASENLRAQVLRRAEDRWSLPAGAATLADGRIVAGDRSWPVAAVAPCEATGDADELAAGGATMPLFWEVCVAGAEVAVDPDTGVVDVRRTATVADVGTAMNPSLVERQDEGCTLQAVGNALFERMEFEHGVLLNDTLLDYRVPTVADVPHTMACLIVENGDGPGPFGAKGCGESVFGGLMGALVCAVADAGVAMRRLPMSPDQVWHRIQQVAGE